jgi:hypothetical protein
MTMSNAVVSAREREAFDEAHRCEEFTSAHGLDTSGASDVFGAAICPGCQRATPLTGDPAEFCGQVIRCMKCTRVMVLDSTALTAFAEVVADAA